MVIRGKIALSLVLEVGKSTSDRSYHCCPADPAMLISWQDFRIGPWLVRPSLNRIAQNGKHTPRAEGVEVLMRLGGHAGDVVSKAQLIRTVWADTLVIDYVLIRCLAQRRVNALRMTTASR